MKLAKTNLLVLAAGTLLALASCGGETGSSEPASVPGSNPASEPGSEPASSIVVPDTYERGDDIEIYERVLGEYEELVEQAHAEFDDNARYLIEAQAEAKLLDQSIMVPHYTDGGTYALTRVAPRTISNAQHGLDRDRLQSMVVTSGAAPSAIIKASERAEMKAMWQTAFDAGDSSLYDPATYLRNKGYTLSTTYTTATSLFPETTDVHATYRQSDTEPTTNGIEGLITYDNVGVIRGAMAKEDVNGNPYTVSDDGLTYTFIIRDDAWWVDSNGAKVAQVTAQDFVDGFHHMLDAQGGLEYLADGVIVGAAEYLRGQITDFTQVGMSASGQTLTIRLVQKENYFPSRLVYSIFMPLNREFFISKGGAFGVEEFAAASQAATYTYGDINDPTSILYNSAYYCSQWSKTDTSGIMKYVKNPHYYGVGKVTLNEITFLFDDGTDKQAIYNRFKDGTYFGLGLSAASGYLQWAKDDNLFDDYAYVSDLTATTYFGGFNLNRGAWWDTTEGDYFTSTQSEAQKILNHAAFNNLNFRRGYQHGFDRASWNDVSVGEGVGAFSLRNLYTYPELVKLSADTTDADGHVFPRNTSYGELVEYYCHELGTPVQSLADGQDGWYNPTLSAQELAAAKEELGPYWPEGMKVQIQTVVYAANPSAVASKQAYKSFIEEALGDYIEVQIIEANLYGYYFSGYLCDTGIDLPQDYFDGSGWGPDYVDPLTYLDTFSGLRDASMLKVIGLDVI